MKKHILVTGGAGYIGSVLVGHLLGRGYQVTVIDMLYRVNGFGLLTYCNNDDFFFWKTSVSKLSDNFSVACFDAVVHLASLLRPTAGQENEFKQENIAGTKAIFDISSWTNVKRFIFASTYFNYGLQDKVATENSELNPFCPYTESKVESEKYILERVESRGMTPTVLRFSQAYGLSPSMRWDLLVNRFVRDAMVDEKIVVFEGDVVRSLIHIQDIVRAIQLMLEAPVDKVRGEVFNVGFNDAHYTKTEIAKIVADCSIHRVKIEYSDHKTTGSMPGTRVCFSKIQNTLGSRWRPLRGLPYNVLGMTHDSAGLGLF